MLQHLATSLRLYFRNKMAMLYGYLFPTIFLVAFWVLYRYDRFPVTRHLGELLTVTVLGGACFGLPTSMVSDRERGVWRRYRLTPVPTRNLVASTVVARYCMVVTAGLLQFVLAMSIGMPLPRHPIELAVAFTCVAVAFLGLGLVIAMLADNVPAVQALGQCIFLPMLIIGGVAVPLSSLPAWAQHLSAFFPGRYAVEAMQTCVTGNGLGSTRFSLLALLLIGGAGCVAGAKMFRWDAQQRFATRGGKGWLAVALAAWVAVGVLAESRGRLGIETTNQPTSTPTVPAAPAAQDPSAGRTGLEFVLRPTPTPAERASMAGSAGHPGAAASPPNANGPVATPPAMPPPGPAPGPAVGTATGDITSVCVARPTSWEGVTVKAIDDEIDFTHLPPDGGVVTPIALANDQPSQELQDQLDHLGAALSSWPPARVADPVQRVRNVLYVAAVPDVLQIELERFAPLVVFDQIQQDLPKDQLIKVLFWIACHPYGGDDRATDDLRALGFDRAPPNVDEVRNRAAIYGVKLLGRLIGKIK